METEFAKFETEMNRGFLQLLVLLMLDEPAYGYGLLKLLRDRGYGTEENTLYPLLRRLEKDSLVTSAWEVTEDRPRKFYQITPQGDQLRGRLLSVWRRQQAVLNQLLEEKNHE